MNDRYLYRAKRTDNGEWIIGSLIQADYIGTVRSWISSEQDDKARLREISSNQAVWRAFEVRNDTICQCTGLKDKNGNLIWENDILAGHIDDMYPENATYTQAIWYKNGFYTKEQDSDDISLIDEFDEKYFEVCGNIFDNPELLE